MQLQIPTRGPNQNPVTSPTATMQGDKYRFTVITDGLIRIEWAPDGHFEDRPSAFAQHRDPIDPSEVRCQETPDSLHIHTKRFHLTYNKQEFSPHGLFVVVHSHTGTTWRYGDDHETLGGTYRTLDNIDGRVGLGPGVASKYGFATIDDSHTMLFTKDGFIAPRRPGSGRVDSYLFCYGRDYREAVKALYKVSGHQPLLPRWTLGNWWSRYYEYSADSYIELIDRFKDEGIPLTVGVIDMDWHLVTDERVKAENYSGWTGYTWNKKLFPDPAKFIKECHDRKLKMTLNEHPADGIHGYEDIYEEMAKAVGFDTSHKDPIPFDITNRTFNQAYFDVLLKSLDDDGLDFWWVDWQQGEYSSIAGVDPLWMLNHFHFKYNARLQRSRTSAEGGGSRPIVFSRYAGPGSHRYPIGFSGDTVTTWESLHFQPEFTATASNIGYGWWSHDIGGHMLGVMNDELNARWVQLGVFSPIMRLHSTKNRWVRKEPWNLLGSKEAGPQSVVIEFLRLRHRLIPYLHTMNVRAAKHGEPLIQPIYWDYPEWDESFTVPNQYMFGSQVMIAPITTPQNERTLCGKVKAWLPPGTWVDYFTGQVYDGLRYITLCRTLDKMPILLKTGSIFPLDATDIPENGGANTASLLINLVVGADGKFELIEEHDTEKDCWMQTKISFSQEKGELRIGAREDGPEEVRTLTIRTVGLQALPAEVQVQQDGVRVAARVESAESGALIHLPPTSSRSELVGFFPKNMLLSVQDAETRIFDLLFKTQVPIRTKENIDRIVSAKRVSMAARVTQVEALGLDEDLKDLILEQLLADSRLDY